MNPREAKQKLLLYRPGVDDPRSAEFVTAIALCERDPELKRWFEEHCAFQNAVRKRLHEIPVPDDLKEKLLAARKIIRPVVWWQRTEVLAAAAVLILFIAIASFWSGPSRTDKFQDYRAKMVSTVLREYRMDVTSTNMSRVRQYMAQRGAPSDYELTGGIQRLALAGGGFLRWHNNPVAMVCFKRSDDEMMYLFVIDKQAASNAPPPQPDVQEINGLATASWSQGDRTYVFVGPSEPDFAGKYLSQ